MPLRRPSVRWTRHLVNRQDIPAPPDDAAVPTSVTVAPEATITSSLFTSTPTSTTSESTSSVSSVSSSATSSSSITSALSSATAVPSDYNDGKPDGPATNKTLLAVILLCLLILVTAGAFTYLYWGRRRRRQQRQLMGQNPLLPMPDTPDPNASRLRTLFSSFVHRVGGRSGGGAGASGYGLSMSDARGRHGVSGVQRDQQGNVVRNPSLRSIATLPAYSEAPRETEKVVGREGERDGVDVVVDNPTETRLERLRMEEMDAIFLIRNTQRAYREERQHLRELAQQARRNHDHALLASVQTRRREQVTAIKELRDYHRQIKAERRRTVSRVSYAEVGVASHDGSRVHAQKKKYGKSSKLADDEEDEDIDMDDDDVLGDDDVDDVDGDGDDDRSSSSRRHRRRRNHRRDTLDPETFVGVGGGGRSRASSMLSVGSSLCPPSQVTLCEVNTRELSPEPPASTPASAPSSPPPPPFDSSMDRQRPRSSTIPSYEESVQQQQQQQQLQAGRRPSNNKPSSSACGLYDDDDRDDALSIDVDDDNDEDDDDVHPRNQNPTTHHPQRHTPSQPPPQSDVPQIIVQSPTEPPRAVVRSA